MKRKGELTTQQIVTLIILVAGFAILLFFIFRMNIGQEQEKEVCHNSVLMRDSALIPDEAVPLNCKRQYVCISADKTCEGMSNPILHKVKTDNEAFEVLAKEMADCWWMFGEGKVNYAGKDLIPKWYCAQCSQIAFDNSMLKIFTNGNFVEEEFYKYLISTKMEGSDESYAMYLYGTEDYYSITLGEDLSKEKILLDKPYYVLTAMHSEFGGSEVTAIGTTILTVGSFFIPGFGVAKAGGKVIGVLKAGVKRAPLAGGASYVLGRFLGPIIRSSNGLNYKTPELVEAPSSSEEFQSYNCEVLTTYA